MANNSLFSLIVVAAFTTDGMAFEDRPTTQTFSVNVPPKAAFSQTETQDGLQIVVNSTVDMWLQIDEVTANADLSRHRPTPELRTGNAIILCKQPETVHIRQRAESADTVIVLTFTSLD
ncbi:MAG: hypothetical protein WAO83_07930 [Fuerstiella sp.]